MRLTEKNEMARYGYKYLGGTDNFGVGCQKLGQLEDIEEELGIDLITLFKALKNKIYTIDNEHYVGFDLIEQDTFGDYYWSLINGDYYFKDYGKTWALTKEELL